MKNFALVYRSICLNIVCDDEFEDVIKQHFCSSEKIISTSSKNPTYTIVVTAHIRTIDGIYHKMVDKWFNYSTLDCWIDNVKKICYISNFHADCNTNRNLTIQYFTSNLFNRLLELNGYHGIHSSCVEKDGNGIIFIGKRLAGKTTCMLHLLSSGFNLVNNDTAAIKYFETEKQVEAFSIIKNIFIRMNKSFSTQPQNQKYLKIAKEQHVKCDDEVKLEENRIILTPLELAQLNNIEFVPSVTLKAIVIPQYNPSLKKLRITLHNTAIYKEFFISQVLPLVHDTTSFLNDISIPNLEACSIEECISGLSLLPCYLCEHNENTLIDLSNELQEILK